MNKYKLLKKQNRYLKRNKRDIIKLNKEIQEHKDHNYLMFYNCVNNLQELSIMIQNANLDYIDYYDIESFIKTLEDNLSFFRRLLEYAGKEDYII